MLVALSGYAQVGKDSVGRFLIEDHGFTRFAFADKLREVVYALNPVVNARRVQEVVDDVGWDRAKVEVPEIRRLLQAMGTEAGRKILGENVWVNAVFEQIGRQRGLSVVPTDHDYVITDCRFVNEAQAVKDRGGFVVRVNRPGVGPVSGHPSETSLNDWEFDLVINNDGSLDDLRMYSTGLLVGLERLREETELGHRPTHPLPGYGTPTANMVVRSDG